MTSPDIQIALEVQESCSGLTFYDNTGEYPASPFGYGLPDGPTVNNVTQVSILLTYSLLDTTIEYVFAITNGVITAATISIGGGNTTNILSSLSSTVWPFVSDGFDLTADYGVTLPTFTDDVVSCLYTVSGMTSEEGFALTASDDITVDCNATCCRDKKFIDIDLDCGCNSDGVINALFLDAALLQSEYSADYGYAERAVEALQRANEICDDDCGCS